MNPFWLGVVAGILLGAGVGGHALRIETLSNEAPPPLGPGLAEAEKEVYARYVIAISACVVYLAGFVLCVVGSGFGPLIALLFPFVGVSAVLIFKAKIDGFQITLGIFQLIAAGISLWMLWDLHMRDL